MTAKENRYFKITDTNTTITISFDTRKNLLSDIVSFVDDVMSSTDEYVFYDDNASFSILYKDGTIDVIDGSYDGHKIRKQHIESIVKDDGYNIIVYGNFYISEYGVVEPSKDEVIEAKEIEASSQETTTVEPQETTKEETKEIETTETTKQLTYNELEELKKDLEKGKKHFYIKNRKLEVAIWYDLFLTHGYSTDNFIYNNKKMYFNIEGKTAQGEYFNIKSSDALAKKMMIKGREEKQEKEEFYIDDSNTEWMKLFNV